MHVNTIPCRTLELYTHMRVPVQHNWVNVKCRTSYIVVVIVVAVVVRMYKVQSARAGQRKDERANV